MACFSTSARPVCTILPMPLVDGATAAGFSIVRLLGHGQIGELYLAEHPRLPRHDALKIVSAELSADPEYRYRFKQATSRAAALWHPNIVSLHDRGEFEDRLWLSMDYVDGIDTAQLLTDIYPEGLPPDLVVEIVFAIADALDYAHELGLVHGYVNPTNILISNLESRRRRILLTGFGLPRRPDETNNLTRADLGIGTVSYAAPEQLMDDSIDGRTDLYALAATAFHLLTGSAPFAHMNPAVLISKHMDDAPPRPGDVRPELTYFDTPFAQALKKNPTERFRRCRDFAKALESKEGLGPYNPNAGVAALLTAPETNGAAPTEPPPVPAPPAAAVPEPPAAAVPGPPAMAVPAPPAAEFDGAVDPPELLPEADFGAAPQGADPIDVMPETEVRAAVPPPDVLPEPEVDDAITLAEADVWSAPTDDAAMALRRGRRLHIAGLGLAVLTVAVGGIVAVMALRSASNSDDTPPDVDTPSPVTTVQSARPAPATAVPPPPVVIAPAPVKTPPPARPAPSPSSAATTAAPASSSTQPETTASPTTKTHSPPATTTVTGGLDTRPAVGMPCGPPGSAATSNSGAPVVCADTPGGSAWESPGG
jgi:serine/threonine protein kinase, bacterial